MSHEMKVQSEKVQSEVAELAHKLPEENARPIVHNFVKLMGLEDSKATLEDKQYKQLFPEYERLFNLFKEQREEKGVDDFAAFINEIGQAVGQQERITDYVVVNKEDIEVRTYFNETVEELNFGFTSSEGGYEVDGPLVCVAVGNLFRMVRLGSETHIGQLTQMKSKEDLSTKAHAVIWLRGPALDTAKKTNKIVAFIMSIPSFLKGIVTWTLQSKTRKFGTTAIIVGVFAIFMGYLSTGSTLTTVKAFTWDVVPSWNATSTFLAKAKFW